jgi:hypothetical protein
VLLLYLMMFFLLFDGGTEMGAGYEAEALHPVGPKLGLLRRESARCCWCCVRGFEFGHQSAEPLPLF